GGPLESLGTYLRKEREDRNKTLKDIANKTKINTRYLKAIEEDNYAYIGEEVFVKGFLRAYANALGIDGDDVIRRYKESIKGEDIPEEEDKPIPAQNFKDIRIRFIEEVKPEEGSIPIPAPQKYLPKVPLQQLYQQKKTIILIPLGIIIVIFILLFIFNIVGIISPEHKMMDQTTVVDTGAAKEVEKEPVTVPKDLILIISAIEDTWIAATIDGVEKKDVLLRSGDRVIWNAKKDFVLIIGNAGGVKITFNGKEIGTLGKSGEVRKLVLPKDKTHG
ncbi:MAG: RodZ domain-containing protein, partial [Nitrospirota bacterium]